MLDIRNEIEREPYSLINSLINVDNSNKKDIIKSIIQKMKRTVITEGEFNKVLLDLEIMGLINVSWVTKKNRRIEAVTEKS